MSFKVTESPTGGNAVRSVDVVRVPKPEFNAQYDRNVTVNGNSGPTGTSPSLESGRVEGYNGSGERSADDWNGTDPEGGPGAESAGDFIDGVKIIDGKVGGKIPVDEFKTIRQSSIKNPYANSMTLGKYTNGQDSYIVKAGDNSSYFDMGDEWNAVRKRYNLSYEEMFEYFNKPALKVAIDKGKSVQFSHNPINDDGFLGMEWDYIKERLNISDESLIEEGGMWYVK